MATALLSPVSKKGESKKDFSFELSSYIEHATDNLLLKDFKDCQKTCMCGIARAKQFIEDERYVTSHYMTLLFFSNFTA